MLDMFGDLFVDKEKEKCLQVLGEYGLPTAGYYWWVSYPKRAIDEIYRMHENTNAVFFREERKLIWEEVITNEFDSRFLIAIETDSTFPFTQPSVYVKESDVDLKDAKHKYDNGSLCLFTPSAYSSKMTILQIRNLACAWCFCADIYLRTDKKEWPAAEAGH